MINAEQICKKLGFRHSMLIPDWDEILFENEWKSSGDKDFDRQAMAYYFSNHNENERRYHSEYELWKTWSNSEWQLFKHVKHSSTYNTETGYGHARISINRNKSIKLALKEAKIWLQYLKSDNLGIFEHTLSVGGIYDLIECNFRPKLQFCCYGRVTTKEEFDSLTEALKYISKYHWYEDEEKGDEDGYTY